MPIPLRSDFDAVTLRALAERSRYEDQVRSLLALAMIYDGKSRTEVARTIGITVATVRHWILKFNAAGPSGLIYRATGPAPLLTQTHREALLDMVVNGPRPEVDGVARWSLRDLARRLRDDFALSVSLATLSREVRALGLRMPAAWSSQRDTKDPRVLKALTRSYSA